MAAISIRLVVRKDAGGRWWVVGDGQPIGPYDNRREAREARDGLRRFYEFEMPAGESARPRNPR